MHYYKDTQGNSAYYSNGDATIDCQNCGDVLRILSNEERQEVSYNPYNYIFFCKSCKKDEEERMLSEYGF